MKYFRDIYLVLLMVLVATVSMPAMIFAGTSSVSYEGGAEKYVFIPGSEYTETDLFDNFKGVMPGDDVDQTIVVRNDNKNCDYVKIYMRAIPHNSENPLSDAVEKTESIATMEDFLHQLDLTVINTSNNETIFAATAESLDGLKDNVLLGSFYPGDEIKLKASLSVPIELGNEYANRIGEVDWVFVAEELNKEKPSPVPDKEKAPESGDESDFIKWSSILFLGILLFALLKNRKKEEY